MLQFSLVSLNLETRQYTDEACDSFRGKLLGKMQALEDEIHGLREEAAEREQGRANDCL